MIITLKWFLKDVLGSKMYRDLTPFCTKVEDRTPAPALSMTTAVEGSDKSPI